LFFSWVQKPEHGIWAKCSLSELYCPGGGSVLEIQDVISRFCGIQSDWISDPAAFLKLNIFRHTSINFNLKFVLSVHENIREIG
jgi:hypothetical protein